MNASFISSEPDEIFVESARFESFLYAPLIDFAVAILHRQGRLIPPFLSDSQKQYPVFENHISYSASEIDVDPLDKISNTEWFQWFISLMEEGCKNPSEFEFLPIAKYLPKDHCFSGKNDFFEVCLQSFSIETERRRLKLKALGFELHSDCLVQPNSSLKFPVFYDLLKSLGVIGFYTVCYPENVYAVYDKKYFVLGYDFDTITVDAFWKLLDTAVLSVFYASEEFQGLSSLGKLNFSFEPHIRDCFYIDPNLLKPAI
ncbi:hypothetical protein K9N68_37480 (plasmid) [Kovacikia minuta CCNUW1]|uniref:hypothetical protein n=1 Tax=Kovacikia minuta TaxID=2931930 RepID=UPI001CCB2CBA|nr:hypothetical protein [Kovacikia minuta]UBF29906.1 hypothetical protein K9N68_37480 [Kovacikia minuta CCNUW1]